MTLHLRVNRIIAAVVVALLFGALIEHDYSKWGRMGRAAYLQYESGRFDRHMGPGHPIAGPVFGAFIVIMFAVALYEGLSAALAMLLPLNKS